MDLKQNLQGKLPPYLMPGNVGSYNKVSWPFWSTVDFNLGTNPTLDTTTRLTSSFQVSQESALILMAITRKSFSYGLAGERGPLQFDIRDRQSSRQFNDRPIPLQNIGKRGKPTILPTPLLVMPNAFIDVTLTTWATAAVATVGSGRHLLTFFGYRIRTEDAGKVLSSVFGGL